MRPLLALAAGAVLALATPAAAQPDQPDQLGTELFAEALARAHRNVPANVSDYVLSLTSGPVRTELYVHRDGDGWQVVEQDDAPLADLFAGMILWPRLGALHRPGASAATSEAVRGTRYVGTDTVGNQIGHVLRARIPDLTVETMDIPDSAYVVLDARTRQLLRVVAAADMEPTAGGAMVNGGRVTMEITFGGYEPVNGVTVPRRMTIRMLMQANLTDAERAEMRSRIESTRDGLADDTSQEAVQTRLLTDMFLRMLDGNTMEVSAMVDDVRVNTGPPAWVAQQEG